jgi:hypothetical protein
MKAAAKQFSRRRARSNNSCMVFDAGFITVGSMIGLRLAWQVLCKPHALIKSNYLRRAKE